MPLLLLMTPTMILMLFLPIYHLLNCKISVNAWTTSLNSRYWPLPIHSFINKLHIFNLWTVPSNTWSIFFKRNKESYTRCFPFWKLKGSQRYWLSSLFKKRLSGISLTKSTDNNDNPLLLSLFLIPHLFHLQFPLNLQLLLQSLQLPLQNHYPLITLPRHCFLPWNPMKFVARVVTKLDIYWRNADITIAGTWFYKLMLPYHMGRRWRHTIPGRILSCFWSWRRLGHLWLRRGVMLWFFDFFSLLLTVDDTWMHLHGSLPFFTLIFSIFTSLLHITHFPHAFHFSFCFIQCMDYTHRPCLCLMLFLSSYINE